MSERLRAEEIETVRTAGATWCSELTFRRILNDLESANASLSALRAFIEDVAKCEYHTTGLYCPHSEAARVLLRGSWPE